MKKITKLLVFFIGLVLSVSIARAQVVVTIDSIGAPKPGDTVKVTLKVTSFKQIGSIGLIFSWDSTKLKYANDSIYPIVWSSAFTPSLGTPLANVDTVTNCNCAMNNNGGKVLIAWAYSATGKGITIANGGTLVTFRFVYLGPTGCVPMVWDTVNSTVSDYQSNPLSTTYNDGKVCKQVICPTITIQPSNDIVCAGGTATFNVSTTNGATFQWLASINGSVGSYYPVVIGTDSTLSIPSIASDFNGYYYECVITNADSSCSKTSSAVTLTVNALPTVNITPPGTIIQLPPVGLTANPNVTVTYQWENQSGNINGATDATLSVTETGIYNVIVTDSNSCNGVSNLDTITILVPLTIDSIIASPVTICAGSNSTLTVYQHGGSGVYTWSWSTGDETQSIIVAPTTSQWYSVIVNDGTTALTDSVYVNVNQIPVPVIAVEIAGFCPNDSTQLFVSNGPFATYQWLNGGETIAGAVNNTYYATAAGSYSLMVTNFGCTGNSSNTLSISAYIVNVNVTPAGPVSGDTTLTANTSPNIVSYQWYNGEGLIEGATNSTYAAVPTDSYYVIVNADNGCSATSNSVQVNPTNIIQLTLTATPDTICTGGSSTLNVIATGGSGSYTWDWSTDDETQSISVSPTSSQWYSVIVNDGTNAVTDSIFVVVNPLPTAMLTGDATICAGGSTNLTIDLTGTGPWSITGTDGTNPQMFNNITSSPFITSVSPSQTTTYTLTAVSDATICPGTTSGSATVTVNPASIVSVMINANTNPVCTGTQVTFIATPTNGGDTPSYQWMVNSENEGSNSSIFSYTPLDGDIVSCMLTTSLTTCVTGSPATSNMVTMTVNPLPTAVISGTTSICSGGTANLSIALTGTGPWNITYSDGNITIPINGLLSSPAVIGVTPSANTTYTLKAVIDANCTGTNFSGSAAVTVNTTPVANLSPVSYAFIGENPILTDTTATLVANPQGAGYTYQWYFNGSPLGSAVANPVYVVVAPSGYGSYTVVVNSPTCSSMPSASLTVQSLSICAMATNLQVLSNSNGVVVLTWKENTPGQTFIVRLAEVLPPSGPGKDSTYLYNYRYRVTSDTIATFSDLIADTIYRWTVKAYCGAKFDNLGYVPSHFFKSFGGSNCPYATGMATTLISYYSAFLSWTGHVPITDFVTNYKIRYFINDAKYLEIYGIHWKYRKFGNVQGVTLPYLNTGTSYGWQVKTMCNDNNEVPYEPTVTYFTTQGFNEGYKLEANNNNDMFVYPNPSNGKFTLSVSGIQNNSIVKITDVEGREVYNQQVSSSITEEIDLSDLAKGMYFVRLIQSDNTQVKKIVIQ